MGLLNPLTRRWTILGIARKRNHLCESFSYLRLGSHNGPRMASTYNANSDQGLNLYDEIVKKLECDDSYNDEVPTEEPRTPIKIGLILESSDKLSYVEKALLMMLRNSRTFAIGKVFNSASIRKKVFTSKDSHYSTLTYASRISADAIAKSKINNWILSANPKNFDKYMALLGGFKLVVDLNGISKMKAKWCYGFSEFIPPRLEGQYTTDDLISCPSAVASGVVLATGPVKHIIDNAHPTLIFAVCGRSMIELDESVLNISNSLKTQHNNEFQSCYPTGHYTEAECTLRIEKFIRIIFHYAPWWDSGLYLTASLNLKSPQTLRSVIELYNDFYQDLPLVSITNPELSLPPKLSDVLGSARVCVGGLSLQQDGKRLVISAALDNIIRGGPYHAMSNIALFNNACAYRRLSAEILGMENLGLAKIATDV